MALDRRHEVDAIRSFALLGICVVNLPFLAMPIEELLVPAQTVADNAAHVFVEVFFQGKFFVLFSFLFGWGFGVQIAAAERHSTEAWPRYRARLAGLFLLGILHAVFVFAGDILMLYAVLGLALWYLRDWTPRRLLQAALVATIVAAFALMALAIMLGMLAEAPPAVAEGPGFLGGFVDATAARVAVLPLAIQIVLLFNGPIAFAAFCAGLAAWKTGFFEPGNGAFERLRRNVPLLAIVGLAASGLNTLAAHGALGEGFGALFGYAALTIGGPALGAAYLVLVVAVARSGLLPAAIGTIGRMSLTAYVLQGVVAGLIFNGYGLGYYGQIGSAGLLLISFVVVLLVHLFCFIWLRFSGQGPLEWVLRGFMNVLSRPSLRPAR
jgi:uncharacterized protein